MSDTETHDAELAAEWFRLERLRAVEESAVVPVGETEVVAETETAVALEPLPEPVQPKVESGRRLAFPWVSVLLSLLGMAATVYAGNRAGDPLFAAGCFAIALMCGCFLVIAQVLSMRANGEEVI